MSSPVRLQLCSSQVMCRLLSSHFLAEELSSASQHAHTALHVSTYYTLLHSADWWWRKDRVCGNPVRVRVNCIVSSPICHLFLACSNAGNTILVNRSHALEAMHVVHVCSPGV